MKSPSMLPLVAVALSGIVLIVAGIQGWGSASAVSYDDWIPTFAGVYLGGLMVIGTAIMAIDIMSRTKLPFRIEKPKVFVGVIACTVLCTLAVILATSVGNEAEYERRVSREQTQFSIETKAPSLEPRSFVFAIVVIGFFPFGALLWSVQKFYVDAFEPISEKVEGLDPMGQIMKAG